MYNIDLKFNLPLPWLNKQFTCSQIGYINFLVGPNGTGKSRFVEELNKHLSNSRLLSSDRLTGLFGKEATNLSLMFNNYLYGGFQKRYFEHYKQVSNTVGLGTDAFILLEEKLDLRIKIEAILTQIFNREIRLEWDSGNLVPKAYNAVQGQSYELHKYECHGIKELIVLLTHIYDDSNDFLIIDEPELNLHPQYQSYILQEIRKMAGDPSEEGKKIFFLVTHSPFILNIKSCEDLASIICFHPNFDLPTHLFNLTKEEINEFSTIIARLNVHHKQLFFADYPVFVEGIFDAQIIKAIQEKRQVSMEGSGSCIIDVGGCEELSLYFKLVKAFNKKAIFIYDLDAIFTRTLRRNADTDPKVLDFLAEIGAGDEFQKVCGELEKEISKQIEVILEKDFDDNHLIKLKEYLKTIFSSDKNSKAYKKARTAYLIHLGKYKDSLYEVTDERQVKLIEAKLKGIVAALKEQNVFLLPHGALEHYLPSYKGNIYEISESQKKNSIQNEIEELFSVVEVEQLSERYGYLYKVIEELPAGQKIDYMKTLKSYISKIIYEIQQGIISGAIKDMDSISSYIDNWKDVSRILTIESLDIKNQQEFAFQIRLHNKWGLGEFIIVVNEKTNAGMNDFELQKI